DRVPPARKVERAASLHELAIRYFSTRGPATEDDFAWWSGLTKADAKSAAYSAEASLESEVIGGRRYWFKPVATAAKIKSPLAHLLPNFDEFFIGLRDRGAIQTKLKSAGAENRLDFLRGHLLIVDGQIVGGWKRTFGHKAV